MRRPERRRTVLVFAGLMLGLFLSELDQTVFATALPTVVAELDAVDQMLWINTAYVLAATVTMPVYGKLGDLVGRRGPFLAGLVIFVLGSVVGGLAPSLGWLVLARVVQGLGAGGLLILIQAIIADLVPARERANYLSVVGAVFALSSVLGPPMGGWLTDGIGWRWAFWLNVPLGAVSIVAAACFLRLPRPAAGRPALDVAGVAALTVGVTAAVLLASWAGTTYAWSSPVVLGLGAATVLAVIGFVLAERRAREPVIPLTMFARREFTVPTVAGLLMAVAMFGTIGYLPTYLQMVTGLSPSRAGLLMLALVAGLGLATIASGQVVSRTGRYRWLAVTGALVVAAALALLSTLEAGTGLPVTGGYLFLLGAGIGGALQTLVLMVQTAVPPQQVGTATAANNFFREIGVSLGTALVGAAFTSRLGQLLADRLPGSAEVAPESLGPSVLPSLPPAVREVVAMAYSDALTPVLLALVPMMLLSAVGLSWVRPNPLPR